MTTPSPILPSTRLNCGFYSRAGKACAHYVQNGGRIRNIEIHSQLLLADPIQINPPPTGPREPYPCREDVEGDLENLWTRWQQNHGAHIRQALRFLFAFCREMERHHNGWTPWARVWIQHLQSQHQQDIRYRYNTLLGPRAQQNNGYCSFWKPHPSIDASVLHAMLSEACEASNPSISHSRRAVVVSADLLGQAVVIKRYAPNPKQWKQKWEVSRARRAWASSTLLEELNIPSIRGLGWLEHYENGLLKESYFISNQLPPMETLRVWLRREFSKMTPSEKTQFRHQLRNEIQHLHRHGLAHTDLKCSNLLVQGPRREELSYYWIDLEDLKPDYSSRRTFIRNLFQLNGSIPREVPLEQRKAFVAGFRRNFPFSTSPWLLTFVQRKTAKRLQDEINRIQGA
ncbi:lipopolysaccharide kinase InaA family protein [Kiritimatiellota bacterium B12222]|nr:lipopolysaccharide kinase InaA family protein [Kiritimatiellota bacterium B12222]